MTALEHFADAVIDTASAPGTEALDAAALHVFDTLGAFKAGGAVEETRALAGALRGGDGPPSLAGRIIGAVASVRATEIDDIHLAACVTPSSVVVPVALALARDDLPGDAVLRATVAGHEAMVRFGCAVGGPGLLARGIWPTPLAAGIGAAATAGALWGLGGAQMAHALGLAGATASGINARGGAPTGRWLAVGLAAANGVEAARAAHHGLTCDSDLFDGRWSAATGIALDGAILAAVTRPRVLEISLKPWCGARQTMAAVAAFRALLAEGIDPAGLHEIAVDVPAAYRGMIDRVKPATDRQESFADLRYGLGLAAFAPDRLYDVVREKILRDPRVAALAAICRITADPTLAGHYPARWPARVTLVDAAGKSHMREVIAAPGDPGSGFGWDEAIDKFARVTGAAPAEAAKAAATCRALGQGGAVAALRAGAGLA